jgi:transcriptional regulator with XRE-family HTH domain
MVRKSGFSQLIRNARKRRGLSVIEVAERVGVSSVSIYYWENDRVRPQDENLSALCRVLKLPIRVAREQTMARRPSFSQLIRNARKGRGLSVIEVAERVGVSPLSIYYWENDRVRPKDENLNALCKVLNLPKRAARERSTARKSGFSQLIYNARKGCGLSVNEVAERVGVIPLSIYFWENDRFRPQDENLSALCKVLRLPIRATKRLAAA